jgi:protein quaking
MDYLAELIRERKQLAFFPNLFSHMERLADDEIQRVRGIIFQADFSGSVSELPPPEGEIVILQEKVYVPVKAFPNYNFVGRILGPRGMTAKQLEQDTGCKIMVRGKGSLRDRQREELNRGRPSWEHLEEELHVLIQCEDTPNRAPTKLQAAVEKVKKLLVPAPDGTDELKRKQLMELAIINGTYRPSHEKVLSPAIPSRLSSSASAITASPQMTPTARFSLPAFNSPPQTSPIGSYHHGLPPTPPSTGFMGFEDTFDFNFNLIPNRSNFVSDVFEDSLDNKCC